MSANVPFSASLQITVTFMSDAWSARAEPVV